jgi:hypothetical protein
MNTFKNLIDDAKKTPYKDINVPLYMVTKNTGKITVITKSHIIQFTNDVIIYCARRKDFRIEKNTDTTVLERIVYTGFYGNQKMVTDYLYINKEDAKQKAMEILNEKRRKIFDLILKVTEL